MKKNKVLLALALPSLCFTVASCNAKQDTKQAHLFWAYSTENLLGDYDYTAKKDEEGEPIDDNEQFIKRDSTLRFNCIKGENEGAQLMVFAKKYIDKFDFKLPEKLKNGKDEIDGSNFTVAAAWYQDVYGTNEKKADNGYYPDALVPLENYKFRRQNHIDKGRNQSLYVNFVSTYDMKPGTYKGDGTLILDKKEYKVPFEVTIYEAYMPQAQHFQRQYLIWYGEVANGELKNADLAMKDKYYDFVVSKRIAPDGLPEEYERSPESFVKAYEERVVNNPMISAYRFPIEGENYITKPNIKAYMNALIDRNLELRAQGDTTSDFFKKLCFYVDDEPTASRYEKVRLHDQIIYECKCDLAYRLAEYPDLLDSFIHIKNVVTTEYNEDLVATEERGGVQTWCPQFQKFQTKEARETYKARMASNDRTGGENVFWYGCMDPVSPYTSFHLDADLLNSRILSYMEFAYGIQGNIFWCVNYFSKFTHNATTGRDLWHDPISWENCAGDGMLLYPGTEFAVDGPITTLRLESILATNEEGEYLWMIDQKIKEFNKANGLTGEDAYDTVELLQKYFDKLFTNVIATTSDDDFNDVRLNLLKILETFETKGAEAGISALMK